MSVPSATDIAQARAWDGAWLPTGDPRWRRVAQLQRERLLTLDQLSQDGAFLVFHEPAPKEQA